MSNIHRKAPASGLHWSSTPAIQLLVACAHDPPEARSVPAPVEVSPPEAAPVVQPADTALEVREGIRSSCSLPDTRDGSPQFEFDSASCARGVSPYSMASPRAC